jgi:ribonuclease HI
MKTRVWTDGSCNAEGVAGRGGWAALIERDGSTEQLVGSAMETTQNRMELTAVCEALERVVGAIEVRTDSTYIEKCFSEGDEANNSIVDRLSREASKSHA